MASDDDARPGSKEGPASDSGRTLGVAALHEREGRFLEAARLHERHGQHSEAARLYALGGQAKKALALHAAQGNTTEVRTVAAQLSTAEAKVALLALGAGDVLMDLLATRKCWEEVAELYEAAGQWADAFSAWTRAETADDRIRRSNAQKAGLRCLQELIRQAEGDPAALAAVLPRLAALNPQTAAMLFAVVKNQAARVPHLTGASLVSRVTETLLQAICRTGKANPNLVPNDHGLVYLYLLACGSDQASAVPPPLLAACPEVNRELPLANQFSHSFGPALCHTVRVIGNAGYRLSTLQVMSGSTQLCLTRAIGRTTGAKELRVFLLYGYSEKALAQFASCLHAQANEAKVVVLCPYDPARPVDELFSNRVMVHARTYGAALGTASEKLTIDEVERWIGVASNDEIDNPVLAFPSVTAALREDHFVWRTTVLSDLARAFDHAQGPLAIYGMRKAGKTAAARLFALSTGKTFSHLDLRRAKDQARVMPELRALAANMRAPTLLILDEFDYFSQQLSKLPDEKAMHFLVALQDASSRHSVLCIGLDPGAFSLVCPRTTPLQVLRRFRLPNFREPEATELLRRMIGRLNVPSEDAARMFRLSGGHPVLLRELLEIAIEQQFPRDQSRLPVTAVIKFPDELATALLQPNMASRRRLALRRILDSRLPSKDAGLARVDHGWRLAEAVARVAPECTTFAQLLAIEKDLGGDRPGELGDGLEQLQDWGLLRREGDNSFVFGIPLLRAELRIEANMEPS